MYSVWYLRYIFSSYKISFFFLIHTYKRDMPDSYVTFWICENKTCIRYTSASRQRKRAFPHIIDVRYCKTTRESCSFRTLTFNMWNGFCSSNVSFDIDCYEKRATGQRLAMHRQLTWRCKCPWAMMTTSRHVTRQFVCLRPYLYKKMLKYK